MSKPPPTDEEMDALFGFPKRQPTPRELENKLDVLGLKIDRLKNEVMIFGIGLIVLIAILYYGK